jgi:DNA-binding transcriptional MerR regulator
VFRIGEFSRLARVSCRLLRHYDALGLLPPHTVDEQTGYRYYVASQLSDLHRILALKDLGLSLEQIGDLLDGGLPEDELRGMLLLERAKAERELAVQAARLTQIESRIARLDAGEADDGDVVVRAEPGFVLLSVRQCVTSFDEARGLIAELLEVVPRRVSKAALGQLVALVHSPEFEPDDIDVELGFVLNRAVDVTVELERGREARVRHVDPVPRMAVCVRKGPPEQAHATTGAIARHIEARGLRLAGPNRELFLQPPRPDRMHDVVVEMQFPCVDENRATV